MSDELNYLRDQVAELTDENRSLFKENKSLFEITECTEEIVESMKSTIELMQEKEGRDKERIAILENQIYSRGEKSKPKNTNLRGREMGNNVARNRILVAIIIALGSGVVFFGIYWVLTSIFKAQENLALGMLLTSFIGVFSFSIECLFSDLLTVITLENSRNMELLKYIVGQSIDLNKK